MGVKVRLEEIPPQSGTPKYSVPDEKNAKFDKARHVFFKVQGGSREAGFRV